MKANANEAVNTLDAHTHNTFIYTSNTRTWKFND